MDAVINILRRHYGAPAPAPHREPIDELIATILSQHTSNINTERAFASLRSQYPCWGQVVSAPEQEVADAIRSGGLANVKAPRIQQVLHEVRHRTGGFDLSFLAGMPLHDARAWLTSLPGVGPKTASCVLLFSLRFEALPVDTHVHRVSRRLGLVPDRSSAAAAETLLEQQLPHGQAFDSHMLLIEHGRVTCVARRPRCHACVLVECCPSAFPAA